MSNNKTYNKSIIYLFLFIIIIVGLVFFVISLSNRGSNKNIDSIEKIQLDLDNTKVIFNNNGLVEIETEEGNYSLTLDNEKVKNIFTSLNNSNKQQSIEDGVSVTIIGENSTESFSLSKDDPAINNIINQVNESGDTGGGNGGDGGNGQLFPTPTTSLIFPPGTYLTRTPTPTPQSGSGCQFWKISWCVFFPSPTPTPLITPTPTGTLQAPANCDLYGSQVTGRTVISNTLCIDEN